MSSSSPNELNPGNTFERVPAEDALRKSEARFRTVIEHSHDGILFSDSNGVILYRSPSFQRINGYSNEERLGHSIFEKIHPDDQDEVRRRWTEGLRHPAEPQEIHCRIQHKDGTWRTVEGHARNLLSNPDVAAVVLTCRDITDHERAEDALREREYWLRESQRVSRIGSYVLDIRSGLWTSSETLDEIFGIGPEYPRTVEGWVALVHPDQRPELLRYFLNEVIGQSSSFNREYMIQRSNDGNVAWVLGRGMVFHDAENKPVKMAGTIQDITERIQNEQKTRNLVTAVEQAEETVVITDLDGTIRYCNPAFERTTGYAVAEVIGQNPRILKSGKQDAVFYERLWRTISAGEPWVGKFTNRKKNGTLFEEEATISCIRDVSGKITGYAAVKRDVTERVALESQLRQSQKLESLGRLAGGVAHDFNNLLTVINGYSGLLLSKLEPNDAWWHSLDEIHKAGVRAAELTKQLLAFSRKQIAEPVPVDLNRLIQENQGFLKRVIGEDVEIVPLLCSNPGLVFADAGQIHQVLMNLAVNARDAMPQGGRLTIKTEVAGPDVSVPASDDRMARGPYVVMTVIDTGMGMDDDVRQHIFEPFFTTKEESKGTGLGLSMVYGIVQQSGGWIDCESELGRGTTFRIGLPRIAAPEPGPAPAERAAGELRGTETILVVEDQEEVRSFAVAVLRFYGYRVLEAQNGEEALRTIGHHAGRIDLILSDVVMPLLNGKELAEQMRHLHPEVAVLLMSGYPGGAVAGEAGQDGGLPYLPKPFTASVLAARVRDVLGPAPAAGRILVVDDEHGVRSLFESILDGCGYEVTSAADGRVALRLLETRKFDLMITDLAMPGKEGIETIQAARQRHPALKVIAVSGAFGASMLKMAALLGAHATLPKPVSGDLLIETVKTVLARG